ncbi:MAG: AmiR/NasT family two-component response regulator [Burkholderiaceae bacterium]|jgi:AmiR/NasT family two-component response regulator
MPSPPSYSLLKDLRKLKVAIIHPPDADGDELIAQLSRIGCMVDVFWPEAHVLPSECGLVLLAVRPETLSISYPWIGVAGAPPIIPVITFENPVTLEAVLQLGAFATIASPVRAFGLLTAIAVTLSQSRAMRVREKYIERLEKKSADQRVIHKAILVLMETRAVTEEQAYQLLRSQAMSRREHIEVIAGQILRAQAVLSF